LNLAIARRGGLRPRFTFVVHVRAAQKRHFVENVLLVAGVDKKQAIRGKKPAAPAIPIDRSRPVWASWIAHRFPADGPPNRSRQDRRQRNYFYLRPIIWRDRNRVSHDDFPDGGMGFRFFRASDVKTPCEAATIKFPAAPTRINASTALLIVPPVEIISSIITHGLARTSPTILLTAVFLPFNRSLCKTATGQPIREA
jgi:hypothetical protein